MNALFDLTGRTAVVTGGGRGIGAMIAGGLVAAGADVVIASRDLQACEDTASALRTTAPNQRVEVLQADLSTEDGCRNFGDELTQRVDRIDMLVNNSGSTWGASLEDFPASA